MGVLENIGYVASASYYPCAEPNPILIIEAAGKAIAPIIVSAATFSCLDFVRMRAGISPWHSRGLRMLIDGAIPPEQKNEVLGIYKFLIPLEKALFFWFVVDLTTEFFARWQSQIFKLGACGPLPDGAEGHGSPITGFFDYHNWCAVFVAHKVVTGHTNWIWPPYILVPENYHMQCTFSFSLKSIVQGRSPTFVETALHEITPHPFEGPGMIATPNWLNGQLQGFYTTHHLHPKPYARQFMMRARTDCLSIAEGGSFACEISPTPIFNKGIFPVNCLGAPPPGSVINP